MFLQVYCVIRTSSFYKSYDFFYKFYFSAEKATISKQSELTNGPVMDLNKSE